MMVSYYVVLHFFVLSLTLLSENNNYLQTRRASQTKHHHPLGDHPGPHSSAEHLPWWDVCVWITWGVCCQ